MITLDFETRGVIDLPKMGATRYALDERTQALCMAWAYDDEPLVDLWHRGHEWEAESEFPQELCDRIASGEIVEAHNAYFEFVIWNYVLPREFPEFKPYPLKLEQMRCSAATGSCLSLPRNLGEAAEVLGLGERKLADGRRLINKLSKPMSRLSGRVVLTPGDSHQRACGKALCTAFPPGSPPFTAAEAKRTLEPVNALYPGSTNPGQSIEVILERGAAKGWLEWDQIKGGYYRAISVPAFYKSEIQIPEYSTEPPRTVFCEDEHEHRANWAYCQQDVRTERAYSRDIPEMTERELEYWRMDLRMNERGIQLDLPGAERALELAGTEAARLNMELQELTGGVVDAFSRRIPLLKWVNGRLAELGAETLTDTKADTLSFALYGVPTKAGDEAKVAIKPTIDAKWEALGDDAAPIKRVLEICMEGNRSSVAKYKRMIGSVCPDGRLHDIMLYNGADRTGRWSGKGVQPHNFVRGYSKEMCEVWDDLMSLDSEAITLMWGEPTVALAKACRGALMASTGKVLYAADFNAIEARKLAWLSNASKLLTLFRENGDPYIAMAEAIYKRPLNKKDNPNERNLGKKAILGLGYAMGWEKFQSSVWMDEGIWLEDEFCQEIVRIYRKDMYPEIPALWKATGEAAIRAVTQGGEHYCGGDEFGIGSVSYFLSEDGRFLHCRLPSGRLLAYYQPRVTERVTYRFAALNERGKPTTVNFPAKKKVPQHQVRWHAEKLAAKARKTLLDDKPENFVSPHLSFMGRDLFTRKWKRVGTHGGSLVENYDQASSRDLLAEAMYRIDQMDGFDLLLSIHDEVVSEAKEGACTLHEYEAIMSVVPDWAPGMPITAEGWIGKRLRK